MPPAFALSQDQTLQFKSLPTPDPEGPDGSFFEGFDLVSRFGPVKGVHRMVAAQLQITELTSGITRMLSLPAPPHSWRRANFYAPGRVVMAWPARFTSSRRSRLFTCQRSERLMRRAQTSCRAQSPMLAEVYGYFVPCQIRIRPLIPPASDPTDLHPSTYR